MSQCAAGVNAADRLLEAIERRGAPICVGLDPVYDRLPPDVQDPAKPVESIGRFVRGVLDAVTGVAPSVKFQSACFERYGHRGVALLESLIADARARELVVVLDAKRGDIGISAEHYAAAVFGNGPSGADWITINAYLGADGIEPFLAGGGAFALVRTSNPGGDALQTERLANGRTVAEHVAAIVAEVGRAHVGGRGYSALGAVVGATKTRDAVALRVSMPQQIFLMPGYGAQGGGVEAIRECVDASGQGVLVPASRSVIYPAGPSGSGGDWTHAVAEAATRLADDVGRAAGMR